MSAVISATRMATLMGDFPRSPAYAGLAEAVRLLVTDGRIAAGTRLPSERDLTAALGVSRTTVTRAYAELRDRGYAEARRGAGTYTCLPGGPVRATDRMLTPRADGQAVLDLNCAAAAAPPGLFAAYEAAVAELPAYLTGHGYFPAGLPELQRAVAAAYDARGLPTDPDQIMVTPGALAGTAVVAQACTGPGDRVLVESPGYPNATGALSQRATRVVPVAVDPDGWDLDAVAATLRQVAPRVAFLVPDFQNPTGNLMDDADRARYAGELARSRTLAVVDEAHQALALDGQPMPRPFAAHVEEAGGEAVTVGSASKMLWGGLRLGWVRVPRRRLDALMASRLTLDLGVPVLEQLVLARLLDAPDALVTAQRDRMREQRDRLAAAVATHLPDWSFRLPGGGLALWCRLPVPLASALAGEAERRGVSLAPGPMFAPAGGHEHFVRIPWTRPAEELEDAVARLGEAWQAALQSARSGPGGAPRDRVMVA